MSNQEIHNTLQILFDDYFNVSKKDFSLSKPLSELHNDFKHLGYLLFLEQLLAKSFRTKIPLLENINSEIHTLEDITQLIKVQLYSPTDKTLYKKH